MLEKVSGISGNYQVVKLPQFGDQRTKGRGLTFIRRRSSGRRGSREGKGTGNTGKGKGAQGVATGNTGKGGDNAASTI